MQGFFFPLSLLSLFFFFAETQFLFKSFRKASFFDMVFTQSEAAPRTMRFSAESLDHQA